MRYNLSDICDYAKGKISVAMLNEDTYISTENMVPNKAGITSATSLPNVTQTQAFLAGDVLVSNIRPYFKKIWFAEFDGGCSNDVLVFRAKGSVSKRFLYYVLADDSFFDYSMATSKGTKMPRGDKAAIMKYEVPDFTYEEQEKIAGILELLDRKIQINAEINENLDEQINSLYSYYFERLPSSELEETRLQDFIFFQEGPGIRNWQYVTEDGVKFINIRCINGGDLNLSTANMIASEEANGKYAHFMLNPYDIVMSCSGTLGRYAIVRDEHLPLCLNTSVIRFRPALDFEDYSYVYGYMTSKEFLIQQEQMANGSAQVNFGPTHLKKIVMHIPSKDLRLKFHEIVFPLINLKLNNLRENDRLAATRDALLPKLMSGELEVSELVI